MTRSKTDEMDALIDQVQKLRTSAGVAQRVLKLLEHANFDLRQVVKLIETDTALAAQILRLVNSSYFGLPRKIASLQQAAACLGAHTLRLSLLNYGVMQCLASVLPPARREEFLRQSLTIAIVAGKLAASDDQRAGDEAYCAGLMVDVGVLVFAQVKNAQYQPLVENVAMGDELLLAEQGKFGFDHAELGARLLGEWGLPEHIAEAVEAHHQPVEGGDATITAVQVARVVAEVLWTPQSPLVAQARELLSAHYQLSTDDFIDLAIQCKEQFQEQAGALEMDVSTQIDVEALRQRAMEIFLSVSVATAIELDGLNALMDIGAPVV